MLFLPQSAVMRVYDAAGNVIETHEHDQTKRPRGEKIVAGEFPLDSLGIEAPSNLIRRAS